MFLLKVNDSVDSINFTELLNKFVLILNHGYGMNIICNNKSKLNINKTKENLSFSLEDIFYLKYSN